MARKIFLLVSVVLVLGGCSASCRDLFTDVNGHLLDTAQFVYNSRSLGNLTADEAFIYQDKIEDAYTYTVDGSVLCDIDAVEAAYKFEKAEDILDAVDAALNINKIEQLADNEGE